MKNGLTVNINTVTLKRMKSGGWGFVTGLIVSADASPASRRMVCSIDVAGAHIKDGNAEWRPLVTTSTMPLAEYQPKPDSSGKDDAGGCFTVTLAPSNKDVIYQSWNGKFYQSQNGGLGFIPMPLPTTGNMARMYSNSGQQRTWNDKSAVHPTAPGTVLLGTTNDGIYGSTNALLGASSTWFAITGVPATTPFDSGQPTPYLVAFDPGNGNYVYYFAFGTGLYRATTGLAAGAFSAVANGPTQCREMRVLPDGTLWLLEINAQGYGFKVWKLPRGTGSTWSSFTVPTMSYSVVPDPANANNIVAMGGDGPINRSTDGGATWLGEWNGGGNLLYQNATTISTQGGYPGGFYASKAVYDGAGVLWCAQGLGISRSQTPLPANPTVRWDWYDETAGKESIGFTGVHTFPGNSRLIITGYDKSMLRPIDLDRYTAKPRWADPTLDITSVNHGYDLDWAPEDINYLAINEGSKKKTVGYSLNGGKDWQLCATQPPIIDGDLVSSPTVGGAITTTGVGKFAIYPGNNLKAYYTLDNGAGWNPLNLPGTGTTGTGSWCSSTFNRKDLASSDKTRGGHAIAVTSVDHPAGAGVWKTADHHVTWTKVKNGVIDSNEPNQVDSLQIDYIPGRSGEILFTASRGESANARLMYSGDDGAAWAAQWGFGAMTNFSFFAPLAGEAYPAIIVCGSISGVRGVYFVPGAANLAAWLAGTPVLVTRYPLGLLTYIFRVAADHRPEFWGRFYIMLSGNGGVYGDLQDIASAT